MTGDFTGDRAAGRELNRGPVVPLIEGDDVTRPTRDRMVALIVSAALRGRAATPGAPAPPRGLVRLVRRLLPHVHRIAGALLVVAGGYVAYYGWYEAQVLGGRSAPRPVDWSEAVLSWITATGAPRIGLLLLAAIALAVLVATGWRSSTAR
jgi:cytochrome c-type biogenesis protein